MSWVTSCQRIECLQAVPDYRAKDKRILAQRVVHDKNNSPWLLTDRNCFVKGDSTYLK
ncbi:MAG: hypothetical protein WA902_20545 [Thermosynechococcaceae cyanobacterium]